MKLQEIEARRTRRAEPNIERKLLPPLLIRIFCTQPVDSELTLDSSLFSNAIEVYYIYTEKKTTLVIC